ncbi:glycopeptide resistance accessory protein VanW [Paenibacillus hemerocallicola]|uniref:Glycopeptide resistance accessory protein VanW n=1 Tax=Paenibacillus hemerocallicola TaxID=1172614 RepID=A0A5C4T9E7_9BACL|nr:glycopeptide resistance accessory protein VanW [Paenibacillus hemerocallicola]TNJ65336.1 glycopeptide resistance accessory protein VanW [Paenibacillus hemerocallicola]
MPRKRVTQIFPMLLPFRKRQRAFCFYMGMHLDKNRYTNSFSKTILPCKVFETSCPLYNQKTGFDMIYQENKVFNLKLAAAKLHTLIIMPGETFSFWKVIRHADKQTPYKDGLTVKDGILTTEYGGGMCHMSNLLFWMFLHTPLTILERRGHDIKDFPEPPSDTPMGVDATVSLGWIDLKVKNATEYTFQICIAFDEECITGSVFSDKDMGCHYEIKNGDLIYYRENNIVYEQVDVWKNQISNTTNQKVNSAVVYKNVCGIGYKLPDHIKVIKKDG